MAENKTKPTDISAANFIAAVPDPVRRADAETVSAMMERLSGEPPVMWGPSIIGFGAYRYRYGSGREGVACRIGFSPRKTELVFYVLDGNADQSVALARLGKHRSGKGCLYVKRLADIDTGVLEELVQAKIDRMQSEFEQQATVTGAYAGYPWPWKMADRVMPRYDITGGPRIKTTPNGSTIVLGQEKPLTISRVN